jgi:hypothetical protein
MNAKALYVAREHNDVRDNLRPEDRMDIDRMMSMPLNEIEAAITGAITACYLEMIRPKEPPL